MLAAQQASDLTGETANSLVLGIDQMPASLESLSRKRHSTRKLQASWAEQMLDESCVNPPN